MPLPASIGDSPRRPDRRPRHPRRRRRADALHPGRASPRCCASPDSSPTPLLRLHARQERQPELPTYCHGPSAPRRPRPRMGIPRRLGYLLRTGPRRGADSVPSTGCTGPAARPARSGAEKHRIETDGRVQVAVVFDSAALARPAANAAPLLLRNLILPPIPFRKQAKPVGQSRNENHHATSFY